MARKPSLNIDVLVTLGPERLARLVLDGAENSPPFRKLVNAALAAAKGPDAVAKLVDRRLAALERARSFIDWEKARTFEADLAATVKSIVDELAPASPSMAIDRLLRFAATHETVFQRIDSDGAIQDVYGAAVEAIGDWTPKLSEPERDQLPERVTASLGGSSYGYLLAAANAIVHHLKKDTLRRWDGEIATRQKALAAASGKERDWTRHVRHHEIVSIRQRIADAVGDLDGLIALETSKAPQSQNTTAIAERLLQAGRLSEALEWVRKPVGPTIRYSRASDLADLTAPRDPAAPGRATLEAQILEAQGDKKSAQALRWKSFEDTLSVNMLKEYIGKLADFEEFEALDRAFDHVMKSKQSYRALEFLLDWPRLDLAAKHVLGRAHWDGRHYEFLEPSAEALEHDHPAAATVLYRAMLDEILVKAKSKAYSAGGRHLARLDALAPGAADELARVGLESPATYRIGLQKKHGRKAGFWAVAPKQPTGTG